ncbi:tetratricopeptide repeat protein [Ekhidna sp.]
MNAERIKLLKQFIDEEPSNPFNRYALAMEYYDVDAEESLELLRKLLLEYPDYLPSYFKAAHLLWDNEEWEEANKVFQEGIELAGKQENQKALAELKAAHQNFEFDRE